MRVRPRPPVKTTTGSSSRRLGSGLALQASSPSGSRYKGRTSSKRLRDCQVALVRSLQCTKGDRLTPQGGRVPPRTSPPFSNPNPNQAGHPDAGCVHRRAEPLGAIASARAGEGSSSD
eukprot:scaffold43514_cov41-Phaeocystis_antarctica.AAC.1